MDLGTLQASVGLDTSAFTQGMSQVVSGFSSMGMSAIALNQSMELVQEVGGEVIGVLKEIGDSFLDTATKIETMKLTLDTITKGNGDEQFNAIEEWAMKMPVYTESAVQSFVKLKAMGFDPTIEDMTVMSDAMSALGGKQEVFDAISNSIGRMSAMGTVKLRQLYELVNAGIPVFDILRKYSDMTEEDIANIGKGGAQASDVIRVLLYGMNQMYGGMSQTMQTMLPGLEKGFEGYEKVFQGLVMGDAAYKGGSGPLAYIETELGQVMDWLDKLKATGQFDQWADEVGQDVKKALESFVDFATEVIANKDQITNVFKTIAGYAGDVWSGLKDIEGGIASLVTSVSNTLNSLPSDVIEVGVVGLLLAGTLGFPGILLGLAKVADDFTKRRADILQNDPIKDPNSLLNQDPFQKAARSVSTSGAAGAVNSSDDILDAIPNTQEQQDSIDAITKSSVDAKTAIDEAAQAITDINNKSLSDITAQYDKYTQDAKDGTTETNNLKSGFDTFNPLAKAAQSILEDLGNAARQASIGFNALDTSVADFKLPPSMPIGGDPFAGFNMGNVRPSSLAMPNNPHVEMTGSGKAGADKGQSSMDSLTGNNKQLTQELAGVGLPTVDAALMKIQGEYEKLIETHKKYFEDHPEMQGAIDTWLKLKDSIEVTKVAEQTKIKLDDLVDEGAFNAANALLLQQDQAINKIDFDAQKMNKE